MKRNLEKEMATADDYDDAAHHRDMEFQRWKAELDASVRLQVANIGATVKTNNAATAASEAEIGRDIK